MTYLLFFVKILKHSQKRVFFLRCKKCKNVNLEDIFMRTKITLACTECKQRNYDTTKNKKNTPDRIEISKYCRFCKKHTVHKESK